MENKKRYFIVVHEEQCEESTMGTLKEAMDVANDFADGSGETYLVAEVHYEVGPSESPTVVKKLE